MDRGTAPVGIASRVPRCRGRSQDAANSSRFLAAKSRLRAVRYGLEAEGEELQTNLLQVSQRGPASSSVLDEVFGTHRCGRPVSYRQGISLAVIIIPATAFAVLAGACAP